MGIMKKYPNEKMGMTFNSLLNVTNVITKLGLEMTREALLEIGECCGLGCIECPYKPKHIKGNTSLKLSIFYWKEEGDDDDNDEHNTSGEE